MFPSTLMSTGGDEVNMNCYAADEETQVWLNETGKTIAEALSDFVLDTHEVLRNGSEGVGGKAPVVWEGRSHLGRGLDELSGAYWVWLTGVYRDGTELQCPSTQRHCYHVSPNLPSTPSFLSLSFVTFYNSRFVQ